MKPEPSSRELLEDLFTGPGTGDDSLGSLLQAVRARRRRRQYGPAVAVLSVLLLTGVWLARPWSARPEETPRLAVAAPIPQPKVESPVFQRVHSAPLTAAEHHRGDESQLLVLFVRTDRAEVPRVTDSELLALAGGRGVGLFRSNGRTELLFVDHRSSVSEPAEQ
ncbi:MAG TPA: hypothetical protein VMB21_00380 [Candidatus Limnocylindria bacterium]|nr:hypothetical protein [Candidatus Limnocylindria bacterium]